MDYIKPDSILVPCLDPPAHLGFWITLLSFLSSELPDKACPYLIYEVLSQRIVTFPLPLPSSPQML